MALQPSKPKKSIYKSTIVEIVMALQPNEKRGVSKRIYNSRNCYGFIAPLSGTSFTVNLQQQKLLWLYSPLNRIRLPLFIYNSRNCYGFIAMNQVTSQYKESTIVEIVMALQPKAVICCSKVLSTIVEIVMALQPLEREKFTEDISTIVEIVMALQPPFRHDGVTRIYNSRNCYGFIALQQNVGELQIYLQQQKLLWLYSRKQVRLCESISTIVEIVMALQPFRRKGVFLTIYNSRNCYGFIAERDGWTTYKDLQQQKLLWLYSRLHRMPNEFTIYNSRNCYGFIACERGKKKK